MRKKLSEDGINALKQYEGQVKDPATGKHIRHKDPTGYLTVGYGHKIKPAEIANDEYKNGLTEDEATELFKTDLEKFEKAVSDLVKVELNQNQFDALVTFTYNNGVGTLKRSSVLKAVNKNKMKDVPKLMAKYVYSYDKKKKKYVKLPGLVARRAAEGTRFATPVTPPETQPPTPGPGAPPPPPVPHHLTPPERHDLQGPPRPEPHNLSAPEPHNLSAPEPHNLSAPEPHNLSAPHNLM